MISTDPTYKEWKLAMYPIICPLSSARILPTRNGNVNRLERRLPDFEHGSYLQGMETFAVSASVSFVLCTDPTYKEWKPGVNLTSEEDTFMRTDPTYKEWKHNECSKQYPKGPRTDPTYKEWKQ